MDAAIFRKEAIAHHRDRLNGEVIIAQPLSWQVLTLLLALCTSIAFVYLLTNDYTRRERVSGLLLPTEGVVAVFAPQPGLLRELYVADGDVVAKGQALFKVQTDQKTVAGHYLGHTIRQQLGQQRARLLDAVHLEQDSLALLLEQQQITARRIAQELAALAAQIATQQALQHIEENAYDRARELRMKGSLSHADFDGAEKNYLAARQYLADLQASSDRTQFEQEENTSLRHSYQLESKRKISELENRVSEIDRQLTLAEGEQSITVFASVGGRVTSLLPSPGQQLDAVRPALTLIPDDSKLEAHLYLPTRAIGFVQERQAVKLRYDAFPYQRFGLFSGRITQVANAAMGQREVPDLLPIKEPVYRITVALAQQAIEAYGGEVMLKPGMLLTADIELDKRSLMEWLLEPLYSLRGRL